MPSWSDDEGRCHFEVNGVPCYQSPVGCHVHRGATSNVKRLTQGERDAYRRGAEAMREAARAACNPVLRSMASRSEIAEAIRVLPIPEDKR